MNLDSIFPYPGFKVKHIRVPAEEERPIRIILERKPRKPMLCHKCGASLGQTKWHGRQLVEDMAILGRRTLVHFRRCKAKCPNCKKIRFENVEFLSDGLSKITKRLAFFLHKLTEFAPVSRLAETLGQEPMTLWRHDLELLQKLFRDYEIPPLTQICVDEVHAKHKHHEEAGETRNDEFFTIITDLKSHKVVWVEYSRRKEAFDKFFLKIGEEACKKIEVVASDEHPDYAASIEEHCPQATHVLDRFHLMKNFEEAVNETRKRIYKMSPRPEVRNLARPKYRFIFLKAEKRRTPEEKAHMEKVMKDNEIFYRLELIKERMITLFDSPTEEAAWKIFEEIGEWIYEAGFPDLKKWWKHIASKWDCVANYFKCRISNALAEGINNVIKATKRRAYGFRNLEYFRLKILQVCGPLSADYMDLNGKWTEAGKEVFGLTESLEKQLSC